MPIVYSDFGQSLYGFEVLRRFGPCIFGCKGQSQEDSGVSEDRDGAVKVCFRCTAHEKRTGVVLIYKSKLCCCFEWRVSRVILAREHSVVPAFHLVSLLVGYSGTGGMRRY